MKPAPHHRRAGPARRLRGVSLIEALVALAVMSIGMLGVAGMQATMRTTADQAKQRSEAVRLAQEKLEDLRAFGVLVTPTGSGEHDYASILSVAPAIVASTTSSGYANTVFTRTVTVWTPAADLPRLKTVRVKVGWYDQVGDANVAADERTVELYSTIAQVAPVLGATLGVPANTSGPQSPRGRHISIPRINVPPPLPADTTTVFTPPGGGGVTWTFINATGLINNICTPSIPCVGTTSVLLSGYIRFATALVQPTYVESETPPGSATSFPSIGVAVATVLPFPNLPVPCYTAPPDASGAVAYACAVPLLYPQPNVVATFTWSGMSTLTGLAIPDPAIPAQMNSAAMVQVCRYTPDPNNNIPANVAHPQNYGPQGQSLANQNFLVIPAGNGTASFTCPLDDGASNVTPLVDGDTRRHQPPA